MVLILDDLDYSLKLSQQDVFQLQIFWVDIKMYERRS